MTQEQKDTLKKLLLDEKAKLESELAAIGSENKETGDWEAVPEVATDSSDENDIADRFENFEERGAVMNALEPRLAEVDAALLLIDIADNSYGVCESCGNDIEIDRMMANPAASTCMAHMQ